MERSDGIVEMEYQDVETEQVVLGGLLDRNETLQEVREFLLPEHFSEPLHARIYDRIVQKVMEGSEASYITLKPYFAEDPVLKELGVNYLAKLAIQAGGLLSRDVRECGMIVYNHARRRVAVRSLDEMRQMLDNPDTLVDEAVAELSLTASRLSSQNSYLSILSNRKRQQEVIRLLQEEPERHPTGLADIDAAMSGGLHKSRSYCIAARPKCGKTMVLGTISENLNQAGCKHLFIAAEMGSLEIEERAMARLMDVSTTHFVTRRNDPRFNDKLVQCASDAKDNKLYLDAPSVTFDKLKAAVLNSIIGHGIKGFILDYLQLVRGKPKGMSEAEHQTEVAQWIAATCKRYGIWALYAAQLNRDGDIRGSDGIVMAADQVYKLHKTDSKALWLEMLASRYTMQADVGSELYPAYQFSKHGTHVISTQEVHHA